MENRFENAYFGKPYKTRDGRKALYHWFCDKFHHLIIEDGKILDCYNDGTIYYAINPTNEDIISEWKDPINEEELDRLAEEFCDKEYENPTDVNKSQNGLELGYTNLLNCFKAGYRKALNKKNDII